MNLTLDQEKSMIINRFCNDIVKAGVSAGWVDSIGQGEKNEVIRGKEKGKDLEKRYDEAYEEIIKRADTPEKIQELINHDNFSPLFTWFFGEHYTVEKYGDEKRIREGPATERRESIKNDIESMIEQGHISVLLLDAIISEGEIGEERDAYLINDKFSAEFSCPDGKAEYRKGERKRVAKLNEDNGWSEYLVLSSISEIPVSKFDLLEEIGGFHKFIDEKVSSSEKRTCKVLIAAELVPVIEEVIEESAEKTEGMGIDSDDLDIDW